MTSDPSSGNSTAQAYGRRGGGKEGPTMPGTHMLKAASKEDVQENHPPPGARAPSWASPGTWAWREGGAVGGRACAQTLPAG